MEAIVVETKSKKKDRTSFKTQPGNGTTFQKGICCRY